MRAYYDHDDIDTSPVIPTNTRMPGVKRVVTYILQHYC